MATAANPHPLSLDAAIKLLTSTMRDPMKANICAIRMGVAADRIDQALEACGSISAKTKFAKSYPELLRVGIKFLTSNQSPQEHVAMVNHLTTCRCDFSQFGMTRLHKPSRLRIDGRVTINSVVLVYDAVATVGNLVILALSDLTQHKFRTGNANNGEQRWPQDPKDLLPFGPKDSVTGLEHWVAAPPNGYIIFKLAGCLVSSHVPFARDVFQYPNFSFALARPLQHLEAAIKFYDEGDSSPLARTHFFDYPVMTIFEFFNNLSHYDTPQFNIMITVRGVWYKPILVRLTTILSTLPPEWSKTRTFVNYLSSYANAELDPKTGVGVIKFDRSQFTEALHSDRLEEAFNTMVMARKMGCWNITCSSAPEVIHSRLCSKCNLIRFCGEKCQKEAWKCATLPHRPVCAKIHSLKESLGAGDWSSLWTADFTYTQFQAMCKIKKVDTEVVKLVGNSISALRVRKSAYLEDLKKSRLSQTDRLIRDEQEKVAYQKLKDIKDSLGHQVTPILNREDSFKMTHRDAYMLNEEARQNRSLDDLD